MLELGAEGGVGPSVEPDLLQITERGHQRLGDVLATVGAEADLQAAGHADVGRTGLRRPDGVGVGLGASEASALGAGSGSPVVARTAAAKAFNLAGSLTPGDSSTPLATSTANGSVAAIASATFSGFSPPDMISG